ncbi:PAS domain S-box/diguanylate cyclase (GGDEF) domain-containing protein (plasmid) [Thermus oshimai JL-2]|jgi:diguanylate cyclase (GGDEF)-like protein/PAS domain S-box-containing protein|uniref:PAS domain S-box/diguanylate cyclase (GGDEF) domain-containing protein n=1 Tax=Thermus oshimai JL-2 TaxID=751945 RepID=K7QZ61_THEOS|nr:EAL domain-containing protein [Thermus oshimai]AFV77403.1 PAS domain S-box/diguanylate cyclase (GGDEF) domain-containing protein [Thermus oshimai JL-2]
MGKDLPLPDGWAVLEALNLPVLLTDREGRILFVNPAFEAQTGYRREEVLGHNPRFLRSGVQGPDFYRVFWETILSGRPYRGTFYNRRKDGTLYAETKVVSPIRGEDGAVRFFVAVSLDTTLEQALALRMTETAQRDELTGLLNRRGFLVRGQDFLARALKEGRTVAVLVLDLVGFKGLNDRFGHAFGDRVLQGLGERLAGLDLGEALLGRMGGDEFALLLPVASPGEAEERAQKILHRLHGPLLIGKERIWVGATLGMALAPQDGRELLELLHKADLALYAARKRGVAVPLAFTPALMQEGTDWLPLWEALEEGRAALFFQPILAVNSGQVGDWEVFLRTPGPGSVWLSPFARGQVPPGPLAHRVDLYVVNALARGPRPPGRFWVNLFPSTLQAPHALQELAPALTPLAGRLVLEVNERSLLARTELPRLRDHLAHLRAGGAFIALDDFGTGHTPLGVLAHLPLDYVKLDRELLLGLGPASPGISLLRKLVELAHDLGARVVAEGVETPDQVQILRSLGVDYLQGFLLGEPRPAQVPVSS